MSCNIFLNFLFRFSLKRLQKLSDFKRFQFEKNKPFIENKYSILNRIYCQFTDGRRNFQWASLRLKAPGYTMRLAVVTWSYRDSKTPETLVRRRYRQQRKQRMMGGSYTLASWSPNQRVRVPREINFIKILTLQKCTQKEGVYLAKVLCFKDFIQRGREDVH